MLSVCSVTPISFHLYPYGSLYPTMPLCSHSSPISETAALKCYSTGFSSADRCYQCILLFTTYCKKKKNSFLSAVGYKTHFLDTSLLSLSLSFFSHPPPTSTHFQVCPSSLPLHIAFSHSLFYKYIYFRHLLARALNEGGTFFIQVE